MAAVEIPVGDKSVRFHESRYAEKGARPRVSSTLPTYHRYLTKKNEKKKNTIKDNQNRFLLNLADLDWAMDVGESN